MDLQDFQASILYEFAICRDDMDKIQDNIHHMELKSDNTLRDITTEFHSLKYDVVSHIYLQGWEDKNEESVSSIFTDLLGWLQGMGGGSLVKLNLHGVDDRYRP